MLTNAQLWNDVENGLVYKGDVFKDECDNYIIFTGKSFQAYYEHDESKFVGMCKNDKWEFVTYEII